MQGNCSAALTPPLEAGELAVPLRAGQCVLVADSDLFLVTAQEIWIDNLLLRLAWPNLAPSDTTRKNQYATLIGLSKLAAPGEHYITRVTFQGDGLGPGVGIWADSQGYVEGARPLAGPRGLPHVPWCPAEKVAVHGSCNALLGRHHHIHTLWRCPCPVAVRPVVMSCHAIYSVHACNQRQQAPA